MNELNFIFHFKICCDNSNYTSNLLSATNDMGNVKCLCANWFHSII